MANSLGLWLIRKQSNEIIGPVSKEQVLEMVTQGHLEALDELCEANGYWFSLTEVEEVRKHLGIQDVFVRKQYASDSETTLSEDTTDTALSEMTGTGEHTTMVARPARLNQAKAQELQKRPALTTEELEDKFQRPLSARVNTPESESSNEDPKFFEQSRVMMVLIVAAIAFILWTVVHLFKLLQLTN